MIPKIPLVTKRNEATDKASTPPCGQMGCPKSQNGLPCANGIHARELHATLATAGFTPAPVPGHAHTPIDTYIYHCADSDNPPPEVHSLRHGR